MLIETAKLFKADGFTMPVAIALECVHCYSLIHDDLPAMDNDDLRRGKPTLHKAYDEATAILSGDALLTFAFELIAKAEKISPAQRCLLVAELAQASGAVGMVGGQMLDLSAEGRFDAKRKVQNAIEIKDLQQRKTGALFRFAVRAGAILGDASAQDLKSLTGYAEILGQIFQLSDDLLDYEGDEEIVGKKLGKDDAAQKATLVNLLGVASAKQELDNLVVQAKAALQEFENADMLLQIIDMAAYRNS